MYTVDDVREVQKFIDMGIDGIASNDPRTFAKFSK